MHAALIKRVTQALSLLWFLEKYPLAKTICEPVLDIV